MQTPLISMVAGQTAAIFPVTGWMRLPDARKLVLHKVYGTEFNTAADDVEVRPVIQFSDDFGWSVEASSDVTPESDYTPLTCDEWETFLLTATPTYGGITYDLDSVENMSHCRLALEVRSTLSGTGDDSRLVPFRASIRYSVESRRVLRIPFERRLVGNDDADDTPFPWRLTGAIPCPLGGGGLRWRAVLSCSNRAADGSGADFSWMPCWFSNHAPLYDGPYASGPPEKGWQGPYYSSGWDDDSYRTTKLSAYYSLSGTGDSHKHFMAFGVRVWDEYAVPRNTYGVIEGYAELFEA